MSWRSLACVRLSWSPSPRVPLVPQLAKKTDKLPTSQLLLPIPCSTLPGSPITRTDGVTLACRLAATAVECLSFPSASEESATLSPATLVPGKLSHPELDSPSESLSAATAEFTLTAELVAPLGSRANASNALDFVFFYLIQKLDVVGGDGGTAHAFWTCRRPSLIVTTRKFARHGLRANMLGQCRLACAEKAADDRNEDYTLIN